MLRLVLVVSHTKCFIIDCNRVHSQGVSKIFRFIFIDNPNVHACIYMYI